ncbi:MAG TPA: enoyl-CoA hydratase/isomerase family protein [Herbaspirillum sp.]|jgi:enoyl-CoA hydratase
MTQQLIVEQDGAILHVTLNRPEQGNGVSDEMANAFVATLDRAAETSEFVVLRGAGEDFCTGRARDPNGPKPSSEAYLRRAEYDPIFNCYDAIRRCPVPVIGVIQGRAMGFGAAVAALCDVSFASDAARFNIPELQHSVMPTMVMSALFDRMNRNAVLWMTYSSDFIDAQRAMAYGLVSTVVPAAKLDEEVAAFCAKLAKAPQPAIRGLKEYMRIAPTMEAQGATDYARSLHAMVNTASGMKKPH